MKYSFIQCSEGVDFSAKNHRKLAFRFNNSKCWFTFFDVTSAYNCRIDACKLGKFYNASYVIFKYLDEINDETVIDVINNRGFCNVDLYTFRKTEFNDKGIRIPTYYSENELFEKEIDYKCY